MTDEEIKERYQRDGGPLGENQIAIEKFINMLHRQEKCEDENIRNITKNIGNLQTIAPNFTIFQSEKDTFFMHQFKALQIDINSDDLVLTHEFGHGIIGMINHLEVPEDFEEIVKRAKMYCINPENKENFRKYMEYLCNKENGERTNAEKGPVSDIISSIFQYPSLTFAKTNQNFVLPAFHNRDYYFNEEEGKIKTEQIFDEDFANFYALTANNCTEELKTLETLFGEEWIQVMQNELEKASKTMQMSQEKITENQAIDQIKQSIMGVSEIPEQIIEKEDKKIEEGERE